MPPRAGHGNHLAIMRCAPMKVIARAWEPQQLAVGNHFDCGRIPVPYGRAAWRPKGKIPPLPLLTRARPSAWPGQARSSLIGSPVLLLGSPDRVRGIIHKRLPCEPIKLHVNPALIRAAPCSWTNCRGIEIANLRGPYVRRPAQQRGLKPLPGRIAADQQAAASRTTNLLSD